MQRFSAEAGVRRPTRSGPLGSYRKRTSPLPIQDRWSHRIASTFSTNSAGEVSRPSSIRTRKRTNRPEDDPQVLLGAAGPAIPRNAPDALYDFLTGTFAGGA